MDRIQKVLDGDLPRESLGPAERAELDAYEQAFDHALAGVRVEPAPDVSARVMAHVAALPRHRAPEPAWRRALDWFWAPRPVAVRPAWGLAAAALAAVVVIPGLDGGPPAAPSPDDSPVATGVADAADNLAADAPVFVHFRLDAADARTVQLAADFTGWEPRYDLTEAVPGVWTVIVPVTSGVHQYAFVVNGERWVPDPLAPAVDDGFGGTNSRLDVVRPEPRRAL